MTMLDRSRLACFKLLAVGLYALASLTLGFHTTDAIPSFVADSELMAVFVLPDVTRLQFCAAVVGEHGHQQGEKIQDGRPLTAASAVLPAPPRLPPPSRTTARLATFFVAAPVAAAALFAPQSRGPPDFLTAFV